MAKRPTRSTKLIANFSKGYAAGWAFYVQDAFKPQLDMGFTERVKTNNEGIKEKQSIMTQGVLYNFYKGCAIPNYPFKYSSIEEFKELMSKDFILLKIEDAKPVTQIDKEDGNVSYDFGLVIFRIYKPNDKKDGLHFESIAELPQDEFVQLLKTGRYFKEKEIILSSLINH